MNKEIAEELARHLERTRAADAAPRCKHVKMNGVRCGSPALRRQPFCWFHERLYNPPFEDEFPMLEDANAIQVGIMQVLDGLRRKRIDTRSAATMLYGLQTASANARRTNLEPSRSSVVLAA